MKLILLVNPMASSVTGRSQVRVAKRLEEVHDVELLFTDERGHAKEIAEQASKGEAEAMIILGGDGTLNEAANGLVGSDIRLGVLPGGSTNVFSRILGFEDDPLIAVEQILAALKAKSYKKVNLGEVNERVFLFHAGIGFDALVVEKVERKPDLKRWMAHPLFAYKALTTWSRDIQGSKTPFTLEFESGEQVQSHFSVCLNANPYTYLGSRPFDLAPKDAGLDKKLVAVTTTDMGAGALLRFVRKALVSKKGLEGIHNIHYMADIEGFRVHSEVEFPYQADGDYLGYANELIFRHRPDSLQLIFPYQYFTPSI